MASARPGMDDTTARTCPGIQVVGERGKQRREVVDNRSHSHLHPVQQVVTPLAEPLEAVDHPVRTGELDNDPDAVGIGAFDP